MLLEDGIELFWQARTGVIGNNLVSYDINGNIDSSQYIWNSRYFDTMKSAGVVKIDDDFVEFCGLDFFNDMVIAIMRHMVNMVSVGYGDSPEEIVEWYSDISKLKFLHGTTFKFYGECEPFVDMVGLLGFVDKDDDDNYFVCIDVRDKRFEILLDSNKILVSFIISTTPV